MITATEALLEVSKESSLKGLNKTVVGSTYILGSGADVDVIVLVKSLGKTINSLVSAGWLPDCSTVYEETEFASLRKGDINLILTPCEAYYTGTLRASEVCKYLKTSDKQERITIHEIVRDGLVTP